VDLPTADEAQAALEATNGIPLPWGNNLRVNKARTEGSWKVDERNRYDKARNGDGLRGDALVSDR